MLQNKSFPVPKGGILFSAGQSAYEFVAELEGSNHGETILRARRHTAQEPTAEVLLKCVGVPELPAGAPMDKARARLREEVQLAQHLRHPQIARVHGMKQVEGTLYVITEYVDGNPLNALVGAVPDHLIRFSSAFVLYVGAEVASALAYAHTCVDAQGQPLGIVHRAVDLERIWVTWEGEVKLTDFGLALSTQRGRIASTVRRPQGNVYYSSPEALLGLPVDARSDLFGLGLVLYELATGQHPLDPLQGLPPGLEETLPAQELTRLEQALQSAHEAGMNASVEDLILRAATYTPDDVEQWVAKLAEPLRGPLRRVLQRAPARRHPTAAELEAELRAELDRLGAYGAPQAAAEVSQVLAEAGQRFLGLEGDPLRARIRPRSQEGITTR